MAELTALVVDLRAAWDYAIAHDRPLAVRLAADAYDFAYVRQRLDLLAWGERVASWGIAQPGLPRALAAAAAGAWARGAWTRRPSTRNRRSRPRRPTRPPRPEP